MKLEEKLAELKTRLMQLSPKAIWVKTSDQSKSLFESAAVDPSIADLMKRSVESKIELDGPRIPKTLVLDDRVDEFIDWYRNNMVQGYYTGAWYHDPIKMRDFIEKMAVWFELRYPDYEVNRIFPCTRQEQTDVSDVMFGRNTYINDIMDDGTGIKDLDWNEFYNTKAFIDSLPLNERAIFYEPIYQDIVYWNPRHRTAHLHLNSDGVIMMSEHMGIAVPGISDEDLEGKHIKEVVSMLKDRGVKFPDNNELEKAIKAYDNLVYQKEEFLNCVMYRILERGGVRIGPRRAFIFAKEFGRNIDIPMAYGVDSLGLGLRYFINEYLKAGGSKDLVCYVDYSLRPSKYVVLPTVTIQELLMTIGNNSNSFYTSEETQLHQRLVDALSSQVDPEALEEEQKKSRDAEVKRLRLERKLKKSRQNRKMN